MGSPDEYNCPERGNSGIYLRGRYEIQIGTEGGALPDHEMGAVYSHYPPPAGAELGLGKWTSFDITSVVSGYRIRRGLEVSSMQQLDGCFGLPRFEFPSA